jgi:hypothetical protein
MKKYHLATLACCIVREGKIAFDFKWTVFSIVTKDVKLTKHPFSSILLRHRYICMYIPMYLHMYICI